MAVAFQNISGPVKAGTGTSIVLTAPAGFSAGDLFIAWVSKDHQTPPDAAPAGWTAIQAGAGTYIWGGMWYRIAETGDTSWTWTGPSDDYVGWILRYSGHDATTPIHASGIANNDSSAAINAPSVAYTDLTTGSLILQAVAVDDNETVTSPVALTERFNDSSRASTNACTGVGGDKAGSGTGSTGVGAFAPSSYEAGVGITAVIEAAVAASGNPMWYYNMLRRRNT